MNLYGTPMTCSLASHIALFEAGVDAGYYPVNLATKQTLDGRDYRAVNPKGTVPALELDDGVVLTEGPAVLQYIGDLAPDTGLLPAAGTIARYRVQEWLNFLSTEVHKKIFWYVFAPHVPADTKAFARSIAPDTLAHLNTALTDQDYLTGNSFTVADAYLFTILNWCRAAEISLESYPALTAFHARAMARPHVARAFQVEMELRQQAMAA